MSVLVWHRNLVNSAEARLQVGVIQSIADLSGDTISCEGDIVHR